MDSDKSVSRFTLAGKTSEYRVARERSSKVRPLEMFLSKMYLYLGKNLYP